VHVPESTNETNPDDELTVHTDVVDDEKVLVPAPALGVATAVGFVPTSKAYDPLNAPPDSARLSVLEAAVTVNVSLDAVAAANPPAEVMLAPMVHVPASTKVTAPEPESIVHTDVVEEVNVLVPCPTPAVGVAVKVGALDKNE
jgi:hypothetical protein